MKELKIVFSEGCRNPKIFVDGAELKHLQYFNFSCGIDEVPIMKIEQVCMCDNEMDKLDRPEGVNLYNQRLIEY